MRSLFVMNPHEALCEPHFQELGCGGRLHSPKDHVRVHMTQPYYVSLSRPLPLDDSASSRTINEASPTARQTPFPNLPDSIRHDSSPDEQSRFQQTD